MRIHYLLSILPLLAGSDIAAAGTTPAKVEASWVDDGARQCMFDGDVRVAKCTQFHQIIEHNMKDGEPWREYRWMWKGGDGLEVHYTSRIGIVGISAFTIGELFDARSNLPGHASKHAVSYSPSKEELVIGVPGEGYEFSVMGGPL